MIQPYRSYSKWNSKVFTKTKNSDGMTIGPLCRFSQEFSSTERSPLHKSVYKIIPRPQYVGTKKQREEFYALFPSIANELTESYQSTPDVQKIYLEILHNNVPTHRQSFGQLVITTFEAFASPDVFTRSNIHLSNILAWSVECLVVAWKILDDIMDRSETRRALVCWHEKKDVGLRAINDADFLGRCSYDLLKRYFSKHDIYVTAFEWFHEVSKQTIRGQTMDMAISVNGRPNLNVFNMEKSKLINIYKGIWPGLLFPIRAGMQLAKRNDKVLYEQVCSILFELGHYANTQNHVIDCYGDPLITGKIGRDIHNGKLTWLIIKAFEKAAQNQKEILERHYGRFNEESVLEVKEVYEQLNLFEDFMEYEKENYTNLVNRIEGMPENFPKKYFVKLMNSFFGRDGYIPVPYQSSFN